MCQLLPVSVGSISLLQGGTASVLGELSGISGCFSLGVHGGTAEGAWFHCRQQSELAVSAALHRSMKENVIPPNPCCSAGALLPWGWTKSYVPPRRGGLCAATGLCAAGAVPCPVTPVAASSRNARRSQCQSCYRVVRQVWRPWRKHRRRPARRR